MCDCVPLPPFPCPSQSSLAQLGIPLTDVVKLLVSVLLLGNVLFYEAKNQELSLQGIDGAHPHTLTPSHPHILTHSHPHVLTLVHSHNYTAALSLSLSLTHTLTLPHYPRPQSWEQWARCWAFSRSCCNKASPSAPTTPETRASGHSALQLLLAPPPSPPHTLTLFTPSHPHTLTLVIPSHIHSLTLVIQSHIHSLTLPHTSHSHCYFITHSHLHTLPHTLTPSYPHILTSSLYYILTPSRRTGLAMLWRKRSTFARWWRSCDGSIHSCAARRSAGSRTRQLSTRARPSTQSMSSTCSVLSTQR